MAADAELTSKQARNITALSFATALATPAVGLTREQVKAASDNFIAGLDKQASRHYKLVDMLKQHVEDRRRA